MPMGLISDDDFQKELNNSSPTRHPEKVVPSHSILPVKGRKEGDVNVPDSLRALIGEDAVINGRQSALNLAKDFGISASSVSAYAKGATSTTTYDKPKESIIEHINKSRRRAVSRAQKTLNRSLLAITQEKLDYSDAKDLSGIAKDMSVIIRNLEPAPIVESETKQPQFVIFAPSFRSENSFESITVNE
jgi:predicted transcriptional regulator